MRATRLVSLLLLLQSRDRMTARELADALEVSVRTIYRDVDSLGAAGVPVYGEPGHDGGYRLLDGYRTRLTGLTADEAEALFLTGLPAAAAQLGLTAATTTAQLKLMAALPAELRDRAGRVAGRFHLDLPPWYLGAERTPHLAPIAEATWNQRAVRIRYLRWAEPQEITRAVEPHGLVLKAGNWYLVARAHGQFRTYRISRILDVDVLPDAFERAEGFDLAAHWESYLDHFDRRRHQDTAVLRLSARGLDRLPQLLEPAVVAARKTIAGADPAGWTEVEIPIESVEAAVPELLKFGADVEVVAPEALRAEVVRTVRAMAGNYG
ncbi:YafY family transcriptional regulator [Amycolatopsis sp. OK19-0408]|uniref:YafY family transcriptional regulator n=1 Tax=Amycolatopsis iheyensis TaxID=2945988 RepID=A0A9X2SJ39_9PSEU|nr:YafY family protein [Amycolatopsis iheyensis]MCR6484059.1 YafY family transcriptional regulator [Amycolatopsis iheyensis]